ncbi:MAG: menaquinone biosynthesis protein [Candidatus Sericytochromatia bacterium]|nr:menaquinone biosynthesis protein [Candidatus Sericytochromatia bacterium]
MSQIRVGELAYVSGWPIQAPLRRGLPEQPPLTFRAGRPGELDAWMAAGELDVAPVSTFEYLARRDFYRLVPNLSISAWGRLGSAILFSKRSFAQLSGAAIAVPEFGATSNQLVRGLLHRLFGVEATFEARDGSLADLLTHYDAALLIGDAAILAGRAESGLHRLDLGQAWWQMTHTPLVTSLWVTRWDLATEMSERLSALFLQAKADGLGNLAHWSAEAAARLGVPAAELEGYFSLLSYDYSPVHEQGIRLLEEEWREGDRPHSSPRIS